MLDRTILDRTILDRTIGWESHSRTLSTALAAGLAAWLLAQGTAVAQTELRSKSACWRHLTRRSSLAATDIVPGAVPGLTEFASFLRR